MSKVYKIGNWWINKEEWDFFKKWRKHREEYLAEFMRAGNDEERKKILEEKYSELMNNKTKPE